MVSRVAADQAGGPGRLPRTGLLETPWRIRREGFLATTEHHWHRLGDTFEMRLGPRSLVLAVHPDQVVHVTVSHRASYDKAGSYEAVRRFLTGRGLVASTGPTWRRQRRLMAPLFTPRSVRAYASVVLEEGDRLADRWDRLAQHREPVEMGEEMMRVTAAIILRTMFSAASEDDVVRLRGDVEEMVGYVNDRMVSPPLPGWAPSRKRSRYEAARARVRGYISRVVEERRDLAPDRWPDDLLSRLMLAQDDEGHMSDELVMDEAVTAFFAGHETTARSLASAWYVLADHPEASARLHEELDASLAGRSPTPSDLASLPYTLRVVKEVLRLHPPAPFYVRDSVEPDLLGGHALPAGTAVMLSPYLTHRHPGFWPDPGRFDPDRWEPAAEASRHAGSYHPFATGHRVCIGNHFSLLESHLLLAQLAQRFEVRRAPGAPPARWEMRGVLTPVGGLPMVVGRR